MTKVVVPTTAVHSAVAVIEDETAEFSKVGVVLEGAGLPLEVVDGELLLLPVRRGAPGDTVFVLLPTIFTLA
jgi:hypothetical protein